MVESFELKYRKNYLAHWLKHGSISELKKTKTNETNGVRIENKNNKPTNLGIIFSLYLRTLIIWIGSV